MDKHKRAELIARYKDGYRVVAAALEGATDAELDAKPAPGKWSAREIVHHLADSEMTSAIRLRLLLAEERAAIRPYDQEEFARKLHYDRPIANSLLAFQAARNSTAELLDRLTEDGLGEGGHASGASTIRRRALAGDLCRPRAQSRRSNQTRARSAAR